MKTIILTISLLITIGCKAQMDNNLKDIDMKYFNENNFKDWELDTNYTQSKEVKYLKRGNERMEIIIGDKTKQIVISGVKSPYTHIYRYNANTNVLFQESRRFYSIFIGKTKTYDEMGKLIKTQDWDILYKISIEKLVEIVKYQLKIDLMDYSNQKNVNRYDGKMYSKIPIYVINITLGRDRGRIITIDATTGEILFDKELDAEEEDNYKDEIYQTQKTSSSKKESKFYLEDDEYQKHMKGKKK